jgi:hypothetical protein
MKKVVLLGAGVLTLGLGACDQLPFFKTSLPQRKPGLWEQTVQSDRTPAPMVSQWCFDAAANRQMPVLGRRQGRSSPLAAACKVTTSKSGDGYVMDSQCNFGGASIANHAVASGDFTSKYTIVRTVNVANAPDPSRNGAHNVNETWVFKGACPADIAPGQVKLPDGDVVDMASLRGGRGGMGGGGGGGQGGGGGGGGGQ